MEAVAHPYSALSPVHMCAQECNTRNMLDTIIAVRDGTVLARAWQPVLVYFDDIMLCRAEFAESEVDDFESDLFTVRCLVA